MVFFRNDNYCDLFYVEVGTKEDKRVREGIMRERDFFKVIILNGRPASGKSEVIDFLKKVPLEERLERFHIAEIDEIDDFPMIWTWFEEDMILEKVLGKPRIHTDKDGYFLHEYQWHLLIERISLEYAKRLKDIPNYEQRYTCLLYTSPSPRDRQKARMPSSA